MDFVKDFNEFKKEDNNQIDVLKEALHMMENGIEPTINEGLLKTLAGGAAGFVIGPKIGEAIAKAIGAERGGLLWNLLTSRAFNTLFAAYVAKNS